MYPPIDQVVARFRNRPDSEHGQALALPGLEQLMEDPASKAQLWRALRRSMSRWSIGAESSR